MTKLITRRAVASAALGILLFTTGIQADAQDRFLPAAAESPVQTGVTRQNLQRHDLTLTNREVVQSVVHLEPGASFPAHRHPGEEAIYVLSGTFVYDVEGQGEVTVRAGEALFIPSGAAHSARNAGTDTASELATHIVEKGRPLLSLAE